MNVLLGDISSYKAICVAKFISENYPDIKIYSFDARPFTKNIRTKYVDEHVLIKNNEIDTYLDIIDRYAINCFLPVINENLNEIWKNKNKFGDSLYYLGTYDSYQVLNDKDKLHHLATGLDIPVPKKYKNLEEAEIPFVVKPTNLSSSKGVIYIDSRHDIPDNLSKENLIIQQFIKGTGVGYSFYCKDGIILNAYGHKRLAEYPVTGGSSTYREHYEDNRMNEIAKKVVGHLNYTGFAMFEFKLDQNNNLYLLEVNPRIWGSINQGLANGVNYFEGIFGKPKEKIMIRNKHLKTYIGPLIYLSLLKYFLHFKIEPLANFFGNLFINEPDISLLKDPKGYLSAILRKLY